MNQRSVAYQALDVAWDQVFALMLAGRISTKEAERIKAELERARDAMVPDPLDAWAMEFRSKTFSPTTLQQSHVGTGNESPPKATPIPARPPRQGHVLAMRDRARGLFRRIALGQTADVRH